MKAGFCSKVGEAWGDRCCTRFSFIFLTLSAKEDKEEAELDWSDAAVSLER